GQTGGLAVRREQFDPTAGNVAPGAVGCLRRGPAAHTRPQRNQRARFAKAERCCPSGKARRRANPTRRGVRATGTAPERIRSERRSGKTERSNTARFARGTTAAPARNPAGDGSTGATAGWIVAGTGGKEVPSRGA